ncbi:MAG: DNA polymerase II large subunit [Candidatus Bathyarchaeia archaeon]
MVKLFKISNEYKEYFSKITGELNRLYSIAEKARRKGFDPTLIVEPQIVGDIAERVEKMVGPPGVGKRIRELEKMDRDEMAFKIAEEIIYGKFGKFENPAEKAIRTALAILTEGVTIAPIEGIQDVKIKQNQDGSKYLSLYFAGPIRPAGGTAQALTLVVADFVRKYLGLDRYKPKEEVIKRFVEEVRLYERQVRRFQYHVSDEDLEYAIRNIPVEATGVGTDPYEVSSFRDVPGIETNRVRGGALIVVVDGVIGRARKLMGICERCQIEGWEWLSKLCKLDAASESSSGFMEEIVVGRPVFSFHNRRGGFRLRYGRARNTGLSAVGIHPSTMIILDKFLATGVQLRIELPGKSAAVAPVDSIEPPIVKLNDGSVLRVENPEEAEKILPYVNEVLFLGDILINAGDFLQNNKSLLPAGFDENQWRIEYIRALETLGIEAFAEKVSIRIERLKELAINQMSNPTPEEALKIAEMGVPLHPRYTYLWSSVSGERLLRLRNNLATLRPDKEGIKARVDAIDKETLEDLLIPHRVVDGNIIIEEEAPIIYRCLALDNLEIDVKEENGLEFVRRISGLDLRDKSSVYVGSRMGRPEKAKERKLSPYVHGLFPIELAGGTQRDILKIEKNKTIRVEVVDRFCPNCGVRTFGVICQNCGVETKTRGRCPRCGRYLEGEICPSCKTEAVYYDKISLDIRDMLESALKRVGGNLPDRFKGVKSLMNRKRCPEPLEKGLLRARYDLSVFKDGTIRFDATNVPLTHFKPCEVGVEVPKLRQLGYNTDMYGEILTSPEQMLELKIQDIIIPEECGDYLVKISKFIDDLLTNFYRLEPFYNISRKDELIGHLVLGLSPHTSAAVVGRIIGYTKNRVCYAHPLWHAAKRRNCDGDEDAIMLGLDPLLNFSREFLPEQIGGLMDAPLFLIPLINPSEVDKEAHNFDVMDRYPPEFYRLSREKAPPNIYRGLIDTIGGRLGREDQLQGFRYTEISTDINLGSHEGAYTSLGTMLEKLERQLDLSKKLKAVDAKVIAIGVLNSHLMKDIVGNLNAFTSQVFRCVRCNRRYRRPPLRGVCIQCGGALAMTVHRGGIEKYIEPALKLIEKYDLGSYFNDRIKLIESEISSLFPKEELKQKAKRQIELIEFLR